MSILKFFYDENTETATWMAGGVDTKIRNIKQAIYDPKRNLIVALSIPDTLPQLKIFDEHGQAAEILAPRDSDFQYLLPDNSKGVLIICSETSDVGTFDYKYELVLPEMRLKKIGRAY